MIVSELKKGDRINVVFGDRVRRARVIRNYKKSEMVHIKMGLMKSLDGYSNVHRWSLLKDQ